MVYIDDICRSMVQHLHVDHHNWHDEHVEYEQRFRKWLIIRARKFFVLKYKTYHMNNETYDKIHIISTHAGAEKANEGLEVRRICVDGVPFHWTVIGIALW